MSATVSWYDHRYQKREVIVHDDHPDSLSALSGNEESVLSLRSVLQDAASSGDLYALPYALGSERIDPTNPLHVAAVVQTDLRGKKVSITWDEDGPPDDLFRENDGEIR